MGGDAAASPHSSPLAPQVYAVVDLEGDGRADYALPLLSGYATPNGIAWRGGSLWVAQVDRVLRLDGVDDYALARKVVGLAAVGAGEGGGRGRPGSAAAQGDWEPIHATSWPLL